MEEASKDDGVTQSSAQLPNITHDTPQTADDDYSVPYELKIVVGGGNVDISRKLMIFLTNCLEFHLFSLLCDLDLLCQFFYF